MPQAGTHAVITDAAGTGTTSGNTRGNDFISFFHPTIQKRGIARRPPALTILRKRCTNRVLWLLEELGLPYEIKRNQRHPETRMAPPELRAVHPLGKSPVITDGDLTIAESGAILEYLVECHGERGKGELSHLAPAAGTPEHRQCRFWMHFAEGSLMNWLVMKRVFVSIPKQPMPFFVRPIARKLCSQVLKKLVDPNLAAAMKFMEEHLATHPWFAGDHLTVADFQMSFAVEAALSRAGNGRFPNLQAYKARMESRPAYQRGIEKDGPVIMSA